jgi:hypothetical protein
VDQLMRDIRSRIAQKHGIELSEPQVQELAARRLDAILDIRTISPALVDQLRNTAGDARRASLTASPVEPAYEFEDTTLYESDRGALRFLRRLLNPILKLFFNPNPLIRALNIQARVNVESARREAERAQQQAEWNALHYEIVQRLVTEVSRVSLEAQALVLRVESLAAKVDFNERRVRGLEGSGDEGVRPPLPPAPASRGGEDRDAAGGTWGQCRHVQRGATTAAPAETWAPRPVDGRNWSHDGGYRRDGP